MCAQYLCLCGGINNKEAIVESKNTTWGDGHNPNTNTRTWLIFLHHYTIAFVTKLMEGYGLFELFGQAASFECQS